MKKKIKNPEPDNKGLEIFIERRIEFLRKIKGEQKIKRKRIILKHTILGLEYLLFKWREKHENETN